MAGLPGGNAPGGVPTFWAPQGLTADPPDTTTVLRQPTYTPRWQPWTPPGGTYGFVDYATGPAPSAPDTTHILRAPTFTPTWQPWRLENRGFVQSVPLTLRPPAIVAAPFSQDDWPNPCGAWSSHGENLGFAQSVPLTLAPAAAAVPVFMPGVIVWSNPRAPLRAVDLLSWTQSLSAPDLLPPFAQDDWPNPVRLRPDIVAYWIAGTNLGLLRPDVSPFGQDDWPNPRAPQRGQDFGASTNLGLLRPDVAPFSQDDWPNPRGAQRGQDFVASTNLGLLRPDVNPFIPHDWANPRLALAPVSDWLAQGIRTAVQVQAPFAQYDWSIPRGPINLSVYKFTDYISGVAVQVGPPPPVRQYHWPNPWGAKPSIGLLTWTQSPAVPPTVVDTTHIIRTPTFTPAWQPWQARNYVNWADYYSIQVIPPPSNYDWPNPVGPSLRHVGYQGWINYSMQPAAVVTPPDTTHILRAPLYTPRWQPRWPVSLFTFVNGVRGTVGVTPPVAPPFIPVSWPNPQSSPDRGLYQKWSDYYTIQIIPPPTNYDQPNPRLPQPNRADWIQGTTLTLRPVGVVQAPLRPIDWPNPRAAAGAHFGFAFQTNLGVLRPNVAPFAQDDWPNPQSPRRGPADYIAGTNLGVLRPGVNPEINYDWPNPQAARRGVADWIQSAFAALATAPPPPTPFAQTDWPNPRGAVGVHTGFAAGTNQGLLRPELNPFAQRDWQNPRGAVGSHVGFAAAMQLNLLRPDVNPFLPRDFANPRAPLRSIDLYGWVQALSALVIPPPPPPVFPPIGQYNWPNPAGPQRGIDLFGWSASPTALTLPETIIPPPTVLQPGGAGVPHTFSRKRWKELQALIAAEMAAVAKAERLTKPDKREALLKVARAAAAAVDAAEAEGENPKLDRELLRNAAAIRAAIRSSQNQTKLLQKALAAIEQSHAIVERVDEDEENEMIALLLMS